MRVTEAAALAAGRWAGKGDKEGGDKAAVDQMRLLLASVPFRGVVIIDDAEKDEAPMLHNCEAVGAGTGPEFDVAVDPVDGTTLLAKGMPDALPMMPSPNGGHVQPQGRLYMDKIVVGPGA
jgi:fructose-1,6-bisphosphatase II